MSLPRVTCDQLRRVPIFSELDDELLEAIVAASTEAEYARNEVIIREHDRSTSLFVLLDGRVKVSLLRPDGREAILALLRAGEFFGDMALLDSRPRSASVIAIAPTRVLILTRNEFADLLTMLPRMIDTLLVTLSTRLRAADQKIADLAFLDAIGRVSGVIADMAEREGEPHANGRLIRQRFSHEQLSRMVATTRETVTHCMATLEKRGYIVQMGRDLLVFSSDDLRDDFMTPR